MWILFEFIFAGINTLLMYLFAASFLNKKPEGLKLLDAVVIAATVLVKILTAVYFSENIIIVSSIALITTLILGLVCFKGKLVRTLIVSVFAFITGVFVDVLVTFAFAYFALIPIEYVMTFSIYRILGRLLGVIIFALIITIIRNFKYKSQIVSKLVLALYILPILSIVTFQQFARQIAIRDYPPTIDEMIPILSILLMNTFIFLLIESTHRQNKKSIELIMVKSNLDALRKRTTQLMENQEHIRQISHDFKQHIDILYRLCHEGQYDRLLSDLKNLSSSHDSLWLVNTDNMMLDTLLSAKKAEADKLGVEFNMKLRVEPNLDYINIDICILLGNAIDNAIEACARSGLNKPGVTFDLTANASAFMVKLINDTQGHVEIKGGQIQTSKKDKVRHGLGIKSMNQIVKKLGGNIIFEYANGKFETWISISQK